MTLRVDFCLVSTSQCQCLFIFSPVGLHVVTLNRNKTGNICMYNIEARSCNNCFSGEAISITYSECVVCVFSLSNSESNMYAPYCYLWSATLYIIFKHYLTNGKIFKKKYLLDTKCVFWFSLQLLSETLLILRRNDRDMIKKCILIFM
jgi:hypothetical protein